MKSSKRAFSLLLLVVLLCSGCDGDGKAAAHIKALFGHKPSSAPVENRAEWHSYEVPCESRKVIFSCPGSPRYPPVVAQQDLLDEFSGKHAILVFQQEYDVDSGSGLPEFEISFRGVPDSTSDLLGLGPHGLQTKMLEPAPSTRPFTCEIESRHGREWVITKGYFDKEKKYLAGSNYETLIGGHHFRFSFGYGEGRYVKDDAWRASRQKIEEDVMKSLKILPVKVKDGVVQ